VKEFWDKYKATIGLGLLVAYTLALGVATADEVFSLGIFKTKLEKMIAADIDLFDSDIQSEQATAKKEILEYGDFAVPQLVKALDQAGKTQQTALECLKQITGESFEQPDQWKEWFGKHKEEFK